jgi:hypothetical protein
VEENIFDTPEVRVLMLFMVVKVAEPGVVPPIVPGEAKVAPFRVAAFTVALQENPLLVV